MPGSEPSNNDASTPSDGTEPGKDDALVLPPEVLNLIGLCLFKSPKTLLNLSLASRQLYHVLLPTLVKCVLQRYRELNYRDTVIWSLFRDSLGVNKLGYVFSLDLPHGTSSGSTTVRPFLLASLIQRCDRMRELKTSMGEGSDLLFSALAVAPCRLVLTKLELVVHEIGQHPGKTACRLYLPSLEKLTITAPLPQTVEDMVVALDRTNSLSRLTHLDLGTSKGTAVRNVARGRLHLSSMNIKSSFDVLTNLRIAGPIHPATMTALANGKFGHKLTSLGLLFVYAVNDSDDFRMPTQLKFSFPDLKELVLTGSFHSDVLDGFADPASVPLLQTVKYGFTDHHISRIRLKDYIFPSHLIRGIQEWAAAGTAERNGIEWIPMIALCQRPEFQPRRVRAHGVRLPRTTPVESLPWPHLCRLESVREIIKVEVGTAEILQSGIPPNTTKLELNLIVSGLEPSDVERVSDVLLTASRKSVFVVEVKLDYPGVSSDKVRAEHKEWTRLRNSDKLRGLRLYVSPVRWRLLALGDMSDEDTEESSDDEDIVIE